MKKINYKSDFDFIMRLRDCMDPEKTVEWPEGDFEAVFWAGSKAHPYRAGRRGGVCENCFPTEDGGMHFVFDKHRLGVGTLKWEPHFELANVIYPDGKEDVYGKEPLGIELVDGPGDCPTTAQVEALVPFIRFKYEDLTDEEKAEISKPATDAAASVRELEKSVRAAEEVRVANETARIGAENARELAEQTRQANEQDRTEAEALREVAEEERNDAEVRRAEEFAGWEGEMDSKADRSELSNVLAEETLDAGNFPDINTYTREELKKDLFIDRWNTRAGEYGCYNEATGFFELNGITDIAYEEALRIDAVSTWPACVAFGRLQGVLARDLKVRTVFPFYLKAGDTLQINFFAASNASIEVLRFVSNENIVFTDFNFAFYYCAKLKRIEGPINVNASNIVSAFSGCWALQEVRLRNLRWDINFGFSALLSLASIDYLITNRAGTNGITVTLHPTVYDKIMDEANEEWHALLDKAASKNITIASA